MGVLCVLVGMGLKYYFDEVFDVWSGVGWVISGGGRVGGPGHSTLERNRFIWQAGSKIGGLGIGLGVVLIIVGGIARQSDCKAGQPKIANDKE